ncbi:MAG: TolC family protein [Phycisphaeraceae bacterium]|nr:TolC family protein [Phycisphaeraceae bacterium]
MTEQKRLSPASGFFHVSGRAAVPASIVAAALLGACANPLGSIDSDYGRKAPAERLRQLERFESERYRAPETPAAEGAPDAVSAVRRRFEGLERVELTLEEVRAATLARNLDLRIALIEPVRASERLREEEARFEAVFRPRIGYRETDSPTLDVTASNQQDSGFIGGAVDIPLRTGGRVSVDLAATRSETNNPFFTLNTAYTSDLTLSLSHPLLRGAGRRVNTYSIRVASYQDQITQARTKLEVVRQLAAADRAYWLLDAVRRSLDVAQQQYELAVDQLARARRRVDAGDLPEIEVVRAEAGVAERLEAIIRAENAVLNQQRALKRLINQQGLELHTPTMIVPTSQPDPVRYEFDGPELADGAVARRMEMLELELQIALDSSGIEFAKNQALPAVALDYRYNIGGLGATFSDANDQLRGNDFESWSVSLSGEVPLGNEGAKARVQQAILSRLQRLATREAREQAIRLEVLNAADNVDAGWQRIMAARQNALAAGRAFRAEQRQFDVGASTSTDVLSAAARLADAQRSEIVALLDYQVSLVDLAYATGTLLGAAKLEWAPLDPRGGPDEDPTPPAFPFTPRGVDAGVAPVGAAGNP